MELDSMIPTKFFINNWSEKPIKFISLIGYYETTEIIFPKLGSKISVSGPFNPQRSAIRNIIRGGLNYKKYSAVIITGSGYPESMLEPIKEKLASIKNEDASNIILRLRDPEDPGVENLTKDVPGGIVWITFREPRPDDKAKNPWECQVKPSGLGIYYEAFSYNESGRYKSFASCLFPKGLAFDQQEELLQKIEEFIDWLDHATIVLDGYMCPPPLLDKIRERFIC